MKDQGNRKQEGQFGREGFVSKSGGFDRNNLRKKRERENEIARNLLTKNKS